MASIASMLSKWNNSFSGFMMTVDNIPPLAIFFPLAPERYEDDWSAQYDAVTSPGSRYSYPVFKGCTPRSVNFQLKMDASWPVHNNGDAARRVREMVRGAKGMDKEKKYANSIAVNMAVLEKLKLPKQGVAQVAAGVLGGFTKVRPGVSDPAPPLTLLAVNPTKYYLGYMQDVKFSPLRYTKHMYCTRVIADCKFLVTPDLIFGTLEEVMREVNAIQGWFQ